MTALQLRKLSPATRRDLATSARAHARALSAPMTRIPMIGDPNLMDIANMREGRAMLERRACQYAAWIAATEKPALDLARFNAAYDGNGRVTFFDFGRDGGNFAVDIPAHVLAFDANAPALALPAPDAEPEPAPRCDHTAPLALDQPAPIAAPRAAQAELDELCTLDDDGAPPVDYRRPIGHIAAPISKAAQRHRTRPAKAMREWAKSRAMRDARIAMLPKTTRRAIGARI